MVDLLQGSVRGDNANTFVQQGAGDQIIQHVPKPQAIPSTGHPVWVVKGTSIESGTGKYSGIILRGRSTRQPNEPVSMPEGMEIPEDPIGVCYLVNADDDVCDEDSSSAAVGSHSLTPPFFGVAIEIGRNDAESLSDPEERPILLLIKAFQCTTPAQPSEWLRAKYCEEPHDDTNYWIWEGAVGDVLPAGTFYFHPDGTSDCVFVDVTSESATTVPDDGIVVRRWTEYASCSECPWTPCDCAGEWFDASDTPEKSVQYASGTHTGFNYPTMHAPGHYRLRYTGGALRFAPGVGFDLARTIGGTVRGIHLVHSTSTDVLLPTMKDQEFATQAAAEAAHADWQYCFDHDGSSDIEIYLDDDNYGDNSIDSEAPTFYLEWCCDQKCGDSGCYQLGTSGNVTVPAGTYQLLCNDWYFDDNDPAGQWSVTFDGTSYTVNCKNASPPTIVLGGGTYAYTASGSVDLDTTHGGFIMDADGHQVGGDAEYPDQAWANYSRTIGSMPCKCCKPFSLVLKAT